MKQMKFRSIFTMFLGLVALMSGLAGCEDKITEGEIPVDNEKLVTVPLAFDLPFYVIKIRCINRASANC